MCYSLIFPDNWCCFPEVNLTLNGLCEPYLHIGAQMCFLMYDVQMMLFYGALKPHWLVLSPY